MAFTKHGHGEILPDPDDNQKTAAIEAAEDEGWSPVDEAELAEENDEADADK